MNNEINISKGCLQEKNNTWQAVFHVNGKYKWKSTGVRIPNAKPSSRLYRDAENTAIAMIPELRAQVLEQLQNPNKKPQAKKKSPMEEITLVDLLAEWLEYEAGDEVRKQTLLTYRQYANKRIYPFFREQYPELKAREVTPWIMQEFANQLKADGLKKSSIRKYLVPLRNATAYGVEKHLLVMDPLLNYRYAPKKSVEEKSLTNVKKRKAYTKEECNLLLEAMERDKKAPVCIAITLALKLGLRREEILGLRFRDINFEQNYMDIQNTVTKVVEVVEEEMTKSSASNRRLYFDDQMKQFLMDIKERQDYLKSVLGSEYQDTDHVYARDDGGMYYPDTVNKQLKKFLKKHKLPPVGLHELRHTYCTFLIASGVDVKTVQAVMGHSDSRMTMEVYTHVVDDKKKAVCSAIDGYLKAS